MKFTELKNSLNSGEEFSVYLLEGEDAYFREHGKEMIIKKFVSEPDLNLSFFDGTSDVQAVNASLSGIPFMSKKRMTVVSEFYPDKKGILTFDEFLKKPHSDSVLLIVNEKPCEALKKYPAVLKVDCGKADISIIVKWIKATFAAAGASIDGETAARLAEYCLLDMTRINNETQKLISYAGKGGVIDIHDVDALVTRDMEYKIYEMTNFVGQKKFDKALESVTDMLSKGEASAKLIVSIFNYYRRLLHVALSDLSDAELAKAFGIKEYAVTKTREQAKKFSKKSLKKAVDTLTAADYLFKSGKQDEKSAMWLSLFKIMTE